MKQRHFSLLDAVVRRQVLRRMRSSSALLTDGRLHIILCGTGCPTPDPQRVGACIAIIAGNTFVLFDIGPGSARRIEQERLPLAQLHALFLTHLHSDHIGDLGDLADRSWRAGRAWPLDVYGPAGTEQVVQGFRQAYALDAQFRGAHMESVYPPLAVAAPISHEVVIPSPMDLKLVYESAGGLKVSAFLVDHRPVEPAFGYHIEYLGCVVVLSGDTRKNDNVIRYATGADLLIHEAYNKELIDRSAAIAEELGHHKLAQGWKRIQSYHTTTIEAAQVAATAHVKTLVLTHILPPPPPQKLPLVARAWFLRGMSEVFGGKIVLGADGIRFDLQPNSAGPRGLS